MPDTENLFVDFTVAFDYRPQDEEPCQAEITISLPCDEIGRIPQEIVSYDETIGDRRLVPYWGSQEDNKRQLSIRISAETWKDLQDIICQTRQEVVSILQKVYKRNADMLKAMPDDFSRRVYFLRE